jgi:hypothetical protein
VRSLENKRFSKEPNPAKLEPKGYVAVLMNSPGIPPNPPLSKGGEGGFLKFLANLGARSFLSA